MITTHLSERTIDIGNLFLDPNNPRFWSQQTRGLTDVPDAKIPEERVQLRARQNISGYAIEDLMDSILRNGFLPLDRIVVRELDGLSNKYVVVEGNRRLAALLNVRDQIEEGTLPDEFSDGYLEKFANDTKTIDVLVYDGEARKDIAWLLQGVRHISGIKDWEPAQQGKLVADQIDRKGLKFHEAGQRFGLSAKRVGARYRSFKALEQMRNDDEFQNKAENRYYSLFEEAVSRKPVKAWMEWNDDTFEFRNIDNVRKFYSWICPDEDHGNDRRIHDPRHMKILAKLLQEERCDLIEKIDEYDLSIEQAEQRLESANSSHDFDGAISKAIDILKDVPNSLLSEDLGRAEKLLGAVSQQVETMLKMAKAGSDGKV